MEVKKYYKIKYNSGLINLKGYITRIIARKCGLNKLVNMRVGNSQKIPRKCPKEYLEEDPQ